MKINICEDLEGRRSPLWQCHFDVRHARTSRVAHHQRTLFCIIIIDELGMIVINHHFHCDINMINNAGKTVIINIHIDPIYLVKLSRLI